MALLESIVLGCWLLALLGTILNLLLVRPIPTAGSPSRTPLVSVLIPARDEALAIERTVRAFFAQTYPALEIVVLDDRSTDGTGEIVTRLAAEDSRLTAMRGEEPPAGWLGKPWALHQASLRARGELLLFVDADVTYAPEALVAAVAHLERIEKTMITLAPNVEMKTLGERIAMPMLSFAAFTAIPLFVANRTRTPHLGMGGGTGNLVWRDAYVAAGGHERLKDAVVDDVALGRLLRRAGHATEFVRADHLVSVRMYDGLRAIIEGFTKNSFAVFGNRVIVMVAVLVFTFLFHLMPFALAFTGDRIALATVGVIVLTRLILFAALRYRLLDALLFHPLMIAVWVWIMIRSAWFSGVKKQLTWRGRTYDARGTRFGAD